MWTGCGYRLLTVDVLEVVTALAGDAGNHQEVARLAGALHGIRNELDYRARTPGIRERVDIAIDAARDTLGDAAFDTGFAEGQQRSLHETVAYVKRRDRPVE